MIRLAVDTASTCCGVALFQGQSLIYEAAHLAGKTHSRHLMVMIETGLKQCAIAPQAIAEIAVSRGPGTFTGLRIGISTVKGLAMATGVSVIGVSSLAALVYPFADHEGPVVALMDARRGEVYYARYEAGARVRDGEAPEQVGPPDAIRPLLSEKTLLVGSGAVLYRDFFSSCAPMVRFADDAMNNIRASTIGRMAMDPVFRRPAGPESLLPRYIRPSDAQVSV